MANPTPDRTVCRHESGKGSVMLWTDRDLTTRRTLVLDAKYRHMVPSVSERMSSPETICRPGTVCPKVPAKNVFDAVEDGYRPDMDERWNEPGIFGGLTDDAINRSNLPWDGSRSRMNTDLLIPANPEDSSPPARCRRDGWDLPDIQTVMRIYASMDVLDGMDPTIDGEHPGLAGWMFSGGRLKLLSSSLIFKPWGSMPLVLLKNGDIEGSSWIHDSCAVVPVLDLI